MPETTRLEPELEPTPIDAALILGLLAAWCITLIVGIILSKIIIAGGSFVFLYLAVRIRKTGEKVAYDDSVVYTFPKIPDEWLNTLEWFRDKFALFAAVFIVFVAMGLLFLLLSNAPDAAGVGQGVGTLDVWIHIGAVILTMLTIGVFGSIANKLGYGNPSAILSLAGILLAGLLVPVAFYVAAIYGY